MAEIQIPSRERQSQSLGNDNNNHERVGGVVDPGDYIISRPGLERKVLDILHIDDFGQRVWKHIFRPALLGMLLDAGHYMVDDMLGGGGNARTNYRRRYEGNTTGRYHNYSSNYKHVSYDGFNNRDSGNSQRNSEIIFTDRWKAERVKDSILEVAYRKGFVTVDDVSDFLKVSEHDRQRDDYHWGWYDVTKVKVRPCRRGFYIDLPRPDWIDEEDLRRNGR